MLAQGFWVLLIMHVRKKSAAARKIGLRDQVSPAIGKVFWTRRKRLVQKAFPMPGSTRPVNLLFSTAPLVQPRFNWAKKRYSKMMLGLLKCFFNKN